MAQKQEVEWQAPSHIEHDRSTGWYVGLMAGVIAAAAVVFLLARLSSDSNDFMAPLVIIVFGIILVISYLRRAEQVTYRVTPSVVSVNGQDNEVTDFSGYSVKQIGEMFEIDFYPTKRTKLPISLYCTEKEIGDVITLLESSLPLVEVDIGWFDQLSRRFRL